MTSRARQGVAVTCVHPAGDGELVDALAHDHAVTHRDYLIVSWITSDAGTHQVTG